MKKVRIIGFALLIVFLFINIMDGQSFLKTSGKAIVNEQGDTMILRSMGLGGWMLQEGYMLQTSGFANAQYEIKNKIEELIGKEDTDLFYEKWLENHVQKSDIDSLASWGFNAVRLPMHYNLFTLSIQDEPLPGINTWLEKGFELTDSLITWCKENEMYVLLDLHAAPGGQGYESAISDYNPAFPSLWESKENRDKTVALWKRIAAYYADEPWIMGYDLLNETNWNLPGGSALRALSVEITNAIREVDNKHIVFIEGNWFANDFTGMTPPWDDNMAYAPHKYWSYNETEDIQWVLNIRDTYNVPIYFGESGENSNTWFTDAITLLEGEGLGWAWWPLKKVESISAPFSVVKTPEYQQLLDYWSGSGAKPSAAFAKTTLMELAENLKTENCIYQKDVIDAMFRQVNHPESTIPYTIQNIPGVIYASDFSLGSNGVAYFDAGVADYHVSSNNYTPWNNGWAYRNDGVDIQKCDDNINCNGFNVGWIDQQEWMQYDINVSEEAVYDVNFRVASNSSDGKLHLESRGTRISSDKTIPNTGGWDKWKTHTLSNVILGPSDKKIIVYCDEAGFNLSSMEFVKKSATSSLATNYLSATTSSKKSVDLILNKNINEPLPVSPANFIIKVNNSTVMITDVQLNTNNPRVITLTVNHNFKASDYILISYTGEQILATDSTPLATFGNKPVNNTIINYHAIPGKIEAEDYYYQIGIQLENCSDEGGGKNIAHLNTDDYLDYYIEVENSGVYAVEYRTAGVSTIGKVELLLVNPDGMTTFLHSIAFPPTGGWQNWRSNTRNLNLTAGKHKIRMRILNSDFNINWFEFSFLTSVEKTGYEPEITIYPNPGNGIFRLEGELEKEENIFLELADINGKRIFHRSLPNILKFNEKFDLSSYSEGYYLINIINEKGRKTSRMIMKSGK